MDPAQIIQLFTVKEAAAILGLSIDTLRRYDKRGALSPIRTLGNQRRYTGIQLEEFKKTKGKKERPLTISEASKQLGVSIDTLRRYDKKGTLAAVRTSGNQRRYLREDLHNFNGGIRPQSVVVSTVAPIPVERKSGFLRSAFLVLLPLIIVGTISVASIPFLPFEWGEGKISLKKGVDLQGNNLEFNKGRFNILLIGKTIEIKNGLLRAEKDFTLRPVGNINFFTRANYIDSLGNLVLEGTITASELSAVYINAVNFQGSGSLLTDLNGTNITSGTISAARLSSSVSLLGQTIESSEISDGTIANIDLSVGSYGNIRGVGSLTSLGVEGSTTLGDDSGDTVSFNARVNSSIIPTSTYNLGSSSNPWGNVYANNIIPPATGTQGYWQRNSGALSPTNITDDILIGATASNSAKFGFINVVGGTPAIQINGSSVLNPTTLGSGVVNSSLTSVGTLTSLNVAGGITAGNIVPISDNTYDLGSSPSARWKNLFLGGGSLHIQCKVGDAGCPSSQGLDYSLGINSAGTFGIGANLNSNLTPAFNITQGGNVGIGTSTPLGSLHVSSVASTSAFLSTTNANNGNVSLGFSENASAGNPGVGIRLFYDATANELRFQEMSGADIMTVERITLNVGIGTSAPTYKLEVIPAATTGTGIRIADNVSNPGVQLLAVGDDAYLTDEDVAAVMGLRAVGGAYATLYAIGVTNPSASRFKHDIRDMHYGLNDLLQLNPKEFTYNEGDQKNNVGFIAEEVAPIFPEVVSFDNEGQIMGIDYAKLTPLLVQGIKELNTKVDNNYASLSGQLTQLYLTDTGGLHFVDQTTTADANFTVPHYFTLNDALGNPIDRVGAFKELAVGNLKAGFISAEQITTNALSVTTGNITIQGQSLRNYIASIVNDAISNSQFLISNQFSSLNAQNIISPLAEIDTIHTNLISPLAQNSSIGLKLENDKLSIVNGNSASASAVSSFDNQGNATFSGQLSASSGRFGDASISGTLRAGRILASDIVGLNSAISNQQSATSSSTYITNVTNVYNSTPSASSNPFPTLVATSYEPSTSNSGTSSYGLMANGYIDISSYFGQFNNVSNLSAATAEFSQGLMVFGPTSLSDTSVLGDSTELALKIKALEEKIDTLSNFSAFQATSASILTSGIKEFNPLSAEELNLNNQNAIVLGNLTVGGRTVVNDLGVTGNMNLGVLTIKSLEGEINNIAGDLKLQSQGAGGIDILAGTVKIDKSGNIITKGSIKAQKIEVDTENSSPSVGESEIESGKEFVVVKNPNVTSKSKIFLTPTKLTDKILVITDKKEKESFTVRIKSDSEDLITFDYWIIN